MTLAERQALREKHRTDNNIWCVVCVEVLPNTEGFQGLSGAATPARYPCDVIKVLDATENLNPSDLKTEPEIRASATSDVLPINQCEHLWLSRANAKYQWTVFTYCPKCGEKL